MKTKLERAKQKYQENLRNYKYHKDLYEEHYNGEKQQSKNIIREIEFRMNQEFDVMETLVYIFGENVRL